MRRLFAMWMLALAAAAAIPMMFSAAGADRAEAAFGARAVSAPPAARGEDESAVGTASGEKERDAEEPSPAAESASPEAPPGAVEVAAPSGTVKADAPSGAAEADAPSGGGSAVCGAAVREDEPSDIPEEREAAPERMSDAGTVVRVLDGDSTRLMPLSEYLEGVVAAEMPPSFPEAALEAQAVAARSLVYYRMEHPRHSGAEVCTDPGCCMAFGEPNEASRAAVAATDGMILVYDGEAVMAAFFASSDGRTRSAEEVWGVAVPYLESVASGENMEQNGHGVGMSQYGAREMALEGAGWREILEWYYPGAGVA